MKSKVYFAKSNKANPDHVMSVRALLSNYDIEIVEFKGGPYSHKPMLECDKLFILPDLSNYDEDEDVVGIGKGLHNQIEEWFNYNNYYEVYMIVNPGDDYYLRRVTDLDIDDEDDYTNYSVAILDYNYTKTMTSYLNGFFDKSKEVKPISNKNSNSKYKYLVCSK